MWDTMTQIKIDESCNMLLIEKEGKILFFGNMWDFNIPESIIDLFNKLEVDFEINTNWEYEK